MRKSEDGQYLISEQGEKVAQYHADLKAYFILKPAALTNINQSTVADILDKVCFSTVCRMECVETNAQGKCIAWEKVCETVAIDCPEPPIS